MTRVAAIDCGTNSIRLLVAEHVDGQWIDIDRRMEVVRLGEGIDRTGEFAPAALARTFAACERYATVIADTGARRVRFVATSASRDAGNRAEFLDGVHARLGVTPEVITGEEEARLSFAGAIGGLPASDTPAPRLVVDIGGGSTEFVLGTETPYAACSVNIGCVRMTERHLTSDPPTSGQIADVVADIRAALDHVATQVDLGEAATLIGLAGTVTTVAALALGLPTYDPAAIHGARISAAAVRSIATELLAMPSRDRAALPVMHPGRVDVIGGGSLVLAEIVERVGLPDVVASESDILDGIAYSLVEDSGR